jgi:hypothetical protein
LKALSPTLIAVVLVAGKLALHAQPASVQQFQNSQLNGNMPPFPSLAAGTNAPELYSGESTDVGPQRILRLIPRHHYFSLLLDSQVFYTDNANYSPNGQRIGSAVFINSIQGAFLPADWKLGEGKISSSLGIASQWYNYGNDRISRLDFNAASVFLDGRYTRGLWMLDLNAAGNRLANQSDYRETYREFLPSFTVQRLIPITRTTVFAVGNQVDYHFTEQPATFGSYAYINNRFDDITSVTFNWLVTAHFVVQPSYRFMFTNYRLNTLQNGDRNDYLHSYGIALIYTFNDSFNVRTFFNFNSKTTDDRYAAAYEEFNGGLGVSMNLRF